jgi:hypothetical protein
VDRTSLATLGHVSHQTPAIAGKDWRVRVARSGASSVVASSDIAKAADDLADGFPLLKR